MTEEQWNQIWRAGEGQQNASLVHGGREGQLVWHVQLMQEEAGGQDTVVHWAVVAEARQLALELIDLRPLPRILAAYSV